MTHPHLNTLNQNQLDYQIGGSKQCLASHGNNSTIFAYSYNSGQNDQAVVNTAAKYYNIGTTGILLPLRNEVPPIDLSGNVKYEGGFIVIFRRKSKKM